MCVSTCSLTFLRYDPQGDAEACILDQLNDVGVRHVDDGLTVHCQYPVSHLQLPAAVGWAALNDAANFMGHSCWRIQTQHAAGKDTLSSKLRIMPVCAHTHNSLTD